MDYRIFNVRRLRDHYYVCVYTRGGQTDGQHKSNGVAQLVERRTQDPRDEGSNLVRYTRQVFRSLTCFADSLSVCPTPVCMLTHKNDNVSTLKIL